MNHTASFCEGYLPDSALLPVLYRFFVPESDGTVGIVTRRSGAGLLNGDES